MQRLLDLLPSETELATASLADYLPLAWPTIEPATPLIPGRHIDALCEHLQAVSEGQIQNLLIEVPPGSTKSVSTAVCWSTWEWGPAGRPQTRFIFASHDQRLSTRDSVKCRRLLDSPWYQERWGRVFKLSSDQNVKTFFENDRTGFRLAMSTGTGSTGHRGDILVIDDAHSVQSVESDVQRQSVIDWHDHEWFNRVNDYRTSRRVVIGQRVKTNDLMGHLKESGQYEVLCIPEEYDPKRHCRTSIGWEDWRRADGELLRPERFGPEQVKEARMLLGSYGYAAQHQQLPIPREGGMFKHAWFAIIDAVPAGLQYVRYWDQAGTESGGDYTAGVLMGKSKEGVFYVVDVVRGQWSAWQRDKVMLQTAQLDEERCGRITTWFEQEPGSGGKESAAIKVKLLAGFDVRTEPVSGSKEVRAAPFASQAEAGNVKLVRGPWNSAWIDEMCVFPNGENDDQVDASSGATNKLARPKRTVAIGMAMPADPPGMWSRW